VETLTDTTTIAAPVDQVWAAIRIQTGMPTGTHSSNRSTATTMPTASVPALS
jgi:hypothetical protein